MKVAATSTHLPEEGSRLPAGEAHAWEPGTNQTVCGLPLRKAELARFPHVDFSDVDPLTGGSADAVQSVCHRCVAATTPRRERGRRWQRVDPRP